MLLRLFASSKLLRGFATKSYPTHQLVGLPALSPTMSVGVIGEWKVQEGEEIKPGTVLVDIMTDKASVDFDATEDGYMAKHLVKNGAEGIAVGTPICVIVENAEDVAAFKDFELPSVVAHAAPKEAAVKPKPKEAAAAEPAPAQSKPSKPVEKKLAVETKPSKPAPSAPKPQQQQQAPLERISPLLLAQCLAYEKQYGNTFLVPKQQQQPAT